MTYNVFGGTLNTISLGDEALIFLMMCIICLISYSQLICMVQNWLQIGQRRAPTDSICI